MVWQGNYQKFLPPSCQDLGLAGTYPNCYNPA
jgi:hypothetical protein